MAKRAVLAHPEKPKHTHRMADYESVQLVNSRGDKIEIFCCQNSFIIRSDNLIIHPASHRQVNLYTRWPGL